MKKLLLFISAAIAATTVQAQTKWNLDKSHSQVQFTVSHLMISEVTGNSKTFSAELTAGKPDFSDAQITFTVDVASVNTEDTDRDNHSKSDDFFNAEKYPKMVFKGETIKKTGNNTYDLTGDLTIRDVTKTITLKVVYLGTVKDPWGNIKAGFKVTGKVNRINYNLKWNALTEAGGMVVGEDVDIVINLEFAQAK